MKKIRWLILILGIVLSLAVALQNNALVEIRWLWMEQTLPLSVLLLTTVAIGFLLGSLMTATMLRRRTKKKEKVDPTPK